MKPRRIYYRKENGYDKKRNPERIYYRTRFSMIRGTLEPWKEVRTLVEDRLRPMHFRLLNLSLTWCSRFSADWNAYVWDGFTKEEKGEYKKLNECYLTEKGCVWHFTKWGFVEFSLSLCRRLPKLHYLKLTLTARFSDVSISLFGSIFYLPISVFYLFSLSVCLSIPVFILTLHLFF